MAQKEIKTSIDISAPSEIIWSVLTNFQAYPDWNPFLTSVEGDFEVGNTIKITAGGMKFKPEVLTYNEYKEIVWLGKFLVNGMFDGEHRFTIIDHQDGTSTFQHEEKFSGVLVGVFSKKLDKETTPGFIEMNKKLKEIAEELYAKTLVKVD